MGQTQSWSDVEMGLKAANDKMAPLSLCAEPSWQELGPA